METKNEEMDVAYTPLSPSFEENVTDFVKSKFWSIFLFWKHIHKRKQTKKQIGFIFNRNVFPSQKLSLELFWNIQVLKENYQN